MKDMTREERINSALLPILEKMREHGATDEMCEMYSNGFRVGAMWADAPPHWISVDDELPNNYEPVIAAFGRHFARVCFHCGDTWYLDNPPVAEPMYGITHWMPLPQPPVLSNSEKTGKNHLIDANNMIEGGEG